MIGLANKISVLRILLVPGIVAALVYYHPERDGLRLLALALFLVAMVSDAVDGLIARTQGQQSQLGAFLDPLADKLLILSTLITCSVVRGLPEWMRIPAWFNLIVISRDVLLVFGIVVIFAVQGRWHIRPSRLGKWATFAQMLVIPILLLHLPVKESVILAAAVLTVLSAVQYVRLGIRELA